MQRREALKNLSYLLWIPFAWTLFKLEERQRELKGEHSVIRIPERLPEGISFYGTVLAVKQEKKIRFLSARCTHLGCTINKEEQGKLICPCHGSSYDKNGNNLSGPSVKPLESLAWQVDPKNGDYLVKLTES